ncbi:hypothetical protein HPG69_011022, partial [Diceros bicornis minor]
ELRRHNPPEAKRFSESTFQDTVIVLIQKPRPAKPPAFKQKLGPHPLAHLQQNPPPAGTPHLQQDPAPPDQNGAPTRPGLPDPRFGSERSQAPLIQRSPRGPPSGVGSPPASRPSGPHSGPRGPRPPLRPAPSPAGPPAAPCPAYLALQARCSRLPPASPPQPGAELLPGLGGGVLPGSGGEGGGKVAGALWPFCRRGYM